MTQETQETPTISLRGRTTIERRPEVTITAEHLNERFAGLHFVRRALDMEGWEIRPFGSGDGRLPLLHSDEKMCMPMDASRPRGTGIWAHKGDVWIKLDTSGELPIVMTVEGGPAEIVDQALEFIGAAFPDVAAEYYARRQVGE